MRAFAFGLMIAMAGCAPAANEAVATTTPSEAAAAAPEPARRVPKELLLQGGVDYECGTPADCSIKDVGNCCGAYPQCVNKDSPTFPDQVKADCAQQGMSSICGFPDIASCDCIEGRCTGVPGTGGGGELQKE